jgi:hypothetical protein
MPLLQYFGWVGGFLFAALLAANWGASVPIIPAPHSDLPLNQKINIRIHTDHKWPDRIVFDTTRSAPQGADPAADTGASKASVQADRKPFDALAEMPSPVDELASQNRRRIAARKALTSPTLPHRPPGRS